MRNPIKERVIPMRIVILREKMGLKQTEFVEALNEKYDICNLSVSSISTWETGRRPISLKYVPILMDFFNVSRAYLYGLVDDEHKELSDIEIAEIINGVNINSAPSGQEQGRNIMDKFEISSKDLFKFHMCPVYVEFPVLYGINGWAIYDDCQKEFTFPDRKVSTSYFYQHPNEVKYYSIRCEYDSKYDLGHKTLSFKSAMESTRVYIRMISPSMQVRALYDGWYRHNENRTAFINSRGLVLPYEGIGTAYNAFSTND